MSGSDFSWSRPLAFSSGVDNWADKEVIVPSLAVWWSKKKTVMTFREAKKRQPMKYLEFRQQKFPSEQAGTHWRFAFVLYEGDALARDHFRIRYLCFDRFRIKGLIIANSMPCTSGGAYAGLSDKIFGFPAPEDQITHNYEGVCLHPKTTFDWISQNPFLVNGFVFEGSMREDTVTDDSCLKEPPVQPWSPRALRWTFRAKTWTDISPN